MSFLDDIFITQPEKVFFADWTSKNADNSIVGLVLKPLWSRAATLIPGQVAPNVITIAGLLSAVQAWYVAHAFLDAQPFYATFAVVFFLGLYLALDALDGHHAHNARQESPLALLVKEATAFLLLGKSESSFLQLFARMCNQVATVFTTLTALHALGLRDAQTQWALLSVAQLLSLSGLVRSLVAQGASMRFFTGSGEGVVLIQALLVYKYLGHLKPVSFYVDEVIAIATKFGVNLDVVTPRLTAQNFYLVTLAFVLLQVIVSLSSSHAATRNGLVLALLYRSAPSALIALALWGKAGVTQVIADGLLFALINSDVVLTRMAKGRALNPWVVVLAMLSLLDPILTAAFSAFYFSVVIYDLSRYLHISVFAPIVNVYVDGVYDLFHVGHINAFKNALAFGTRLFVGVMSDEAVKSYKRAPVMTTAERVEAVKTCKFVHKVFSNAPFPGIPEEFIKKNNIHIVCLSAEYEKPDDIYYAAPRKMGITRLTPRTDGISTSDLIKRIINNAASLQLNKQTAGAQPAATQTPKKANEAPAAAAAQAPAKTPQKEEAKEEKAKTPAKAKNPVKEAVVEAQKKEEEPVKRRGRVAKK